MRKLTPDQIQAELESGTELFVIDQYEYRRRENAEAITRVEFFGNTLLGIGAYKARVFVRIDEISDETFYTLDVAHRLRTFTKNDFDTEEEN